MQQETNQAAQRRAGPDWKRLLRPAVQDQISRDMLPGTRGVLRRRVLKQLPKCRLLLVAGISLQCTDTFEIVYDLGVRMREQGGAVVYVDSRTIKGRNTNYCLDFHLRIDTEDFAARALAKTQEVSRFGWR